MASLNRAGVAQHKEQLTLKVLKAAEAAADVLREKLSGGGSGTQYPGQPNAASTEGEYPAEQTGRLRESIGARSAGLLRAEFGSIHDPPDYNVDLHFKPPDQGGRPYMDDALHDRDIHVVIRVAMGVTGK
ncbi:hypothetical protein [Deinococcus hopiensis]|uniref:Uncharacterized protein n=1 Tax=Deinococcus hopiensis KR-140 TaxID=695939 RepID=A0A1W1UXL6_9DEIO|nr:hypothetical protein [Deinococcus hopiensis]SMB85789.1 hypothetical protein SAMN00790413_03544 [Deinococcus hopiensis KR-140]